METCNICGREIKKNTSVVVITRDRWTGKISANPEDVLICEASCLKNALEVIDNMMKDKESE